MSKFAQLGADIARLWAKYGGAYIAGMRNTLLLALIGLMVIAAVTILILLKTDKREQVLRWLKTVFKPAGKALGCADFFIQFDVGKMMMIPETGNTVRNICPCDYFRTGAENRIKLVEILINIGSWLCKG